jgi:hypothetical protein
LSWFWASTFFADLSFPSFPGFASQLVSPIPGTRHWHLVLKFFFKTETKKKNKTWIVKNVSKVNIVISNEAIKALTSWFASNAFIRLLRNEIANNDLNV